MASFELKPFSFGWMGAKTFDECNLRRLAHFGTTFSAFFAIAGLRHHRSTRYSFARTFIVDPFLAKVNALFYNSFFVPALGQNTSSTENSSTP